MLKALVDLAAMSAGLAAIATVDTTAVGSLSYAFFTTGVGDIMLVVILVTMCEISIDL